MGKVLRNEEIILNRLSVSESMSTEDIMNLLQVSLSTARRLCVHLSKTGKAIRTFGGIRSMKEYSFNLLENKNKDQKNTIAIYAASLIVNNDTIFIDSGTTAMFFSVALAKRFEEENLTDIHIVTNSIANTEVLSRYTDVTLTGGSYRPKRRDVTGPACHKCISDMHFTKAFLGADAVNTENGFMTTDILTSEISRAVINRSTQKYVLADASKFNAVSFVTYCSDFNMIDGIITDSTLKDEIYEKYKILVNLRRVL